MGPQKWSFWEVQNGVPGVHISRVWELHISMGSGTGSPGMGQRAIGAEYGDPGDSYYLVPSVVGSLRVLGYPGWDPGGVRFGGFWGPGILGSGVLDIPWMGQRAIATDIWGLGISRMSVLGVHIRRGLNLGYLGYPKWVISRVQNGVILGVRFGGLKWPKIGVPILRGHSL